MTTTRIPGPLGLLVLFAIAATGCDQGSETAGIDGTGAPVAVAPVAAAAYGRLTDLGAGRFVINGVTYDTTKVAVSVNGAPGTILDIAVGDVVLVTGTMDSTSASTGVAQKAVLEHAVVGPVESIDSANHSIIALGQRVLLDSATFDPSVPQSSVAGLAVGDIVEVSGFRDELTRVIASRIVKRAAGTPGLRAAGRVANLDAVAKRFEINSLTVDYAAAAVTPKPSGSLGAGDLVEVSGARVGAAGELLAERVVFKPTDVVASAGSFVNLEGYVTALDLESPQSFEVAGLPITTTSATEKDGALSYGTKTEVRGALNTNGTVVASKVRTPFPIPSGTHRLSGLVFDAYTGPVANAPVDIWLELGSSGVSWSYVTGHGFYTDAAGRYEVTGLPDSRVKLWVGGFQQGYLQPCAVAVEMTRDVTRDIEVVREETLKSFAPPRPITAREPTLTGTVYEVTSTGRQPLVGAYLEVDGLYGLGLPLANTRTDLNARYFLCDLDPRMDLMVWKDGGHLLKSIYPVGGPPSTTLDIEIVEKP